MYVEERSACLIIDVLLMSIRVELVFACFIELLLVYPLLNGCAWL